MVFLPCFWVCLPVCAAWPTCAVFGLHLQRIVANPWNIDRTSVSGYKEVTKFDIIMIHSFARRKDKQSARWTDRQTDTILSHVRSAGAKKLTYLDSRSIRTNPPGSLRFDRCVNTRTYHTWHYCVSCLGTRIRNKNKRIVNKKVTFLHMRSELNTF